MTKGATKFDELAKSFADKLTDAQIIALYQIVDPLTDEERNISDEDLLNALNNGASK